MDVQHLSAPPVLSTPDTHVFEDATPLVDAGSIPQLSDDEVYLRYEIERTVREIRDGRWRRIALQFPDEMLGDGVKVYRALKKGLTEAREMATKSGNSEDPPIQTATETKGQHEQLEQDILKLSILENGQREAEVEEHLNILADTSYGSCCVDEIAAEHVDAEVVVHYGRACLTPTARLPVIYIFTSWDLHHSQTVEIFKEIYSDKEQKVMLMADLPYHSHLAVLADRLRDEGYANILVPDVIHDPSSPIPNRKLPSDLESSKDLLKQYALFHLGPPPTALLLTLTSLVHNTHIYDPRSNPKAAILANQTPLLRRRYALLSSLPSIPIIGILINTLSSSLTLPTLSHIQSLLHRHGKKSYTFVVGKINPAKVANFSEIGVWVVVGCWESSLVESKDFYTPLVTPFELEMALEGRREEIWAGGWKGDISGLLRDGAGEGDHVQDGEAAGEEDEHVSEDDEDAPPEFDLRTGRYVSHARPMRTTNGHSRPLVEASGEQTSQSLIKRSNGDVAKIGGVASPGAEFLKSVRTWKGLGSDYEIKYDEEPGAVMEEGRSGVARGYSVGVDGRGERH